MTDPRAQSQCGACEHYRSPFSLTAAGREAPFCEAFPEAIPDAIWENQLDHRQPIEGDHGVQWTSRQGVYPFPTYAFAAENLGRTTLTAAADVQDGAMVALLPRQADLDRLALAGGEPVDRLHLTVTILPNASAMSPGDRDATTNWARRMAEMWDPFEARLSGAAVLGVASDDPALVVMATGKDLAEFGEVACQELDQLVGIPDQAFRPWVPHITLAYGVTDAPLDLVRPLMGMVTFDRIRVAFGGETFDYYLGDPGVFDHAEPGDEEIAQDAPLPLVEPEPELVAAAVSRQPWDGCPRCFAPVHAGPCASQAL